MKKQKKHVEHELKSKFVHLCFSHALNALVKYLRIHVVVVYAFMHVSKIHSNIQYVSVVPVNYMRCSC